MALLSRIPTNPVLWTLCAVLSVSGCKCKKDKPVDNGTDTVDVADVNTKISVTSIDPSRVQENLPFNATVRGANFASGATVTLGVQDASKVTFLNANQLAIEVAAGLPSGRYDVEVSNPDGSSSILRAGLLVEAKAGPSCEAATVYFATDKSTLGADANTTLEGRAGCYASANGSVRVEGHADERGTTDYNLALGERRAKAVKDFLVGKGVPSDRVSITSFGEEQPVDAGHDEAAWSKNRRAEVSVSR